MREGKGIVVFFFLWHCTWKNVQMQGA